MPSMIDLTKGTFKTSTAKTACNAMPQPIVRQLTARKFDENMATMPKKKITPATP